MTDQTALDIAHAAMEAETGGDAARLRFFERLADSELFLLLTEEASGDSISPEVFELSDHSFALVFDREERLAQFVGRPAPYAAISGRIIAQMLKGQGIGLGLNLEVASSSILIPPEAVVWLEETLQHAPEQVEAKPEELLAPTGLPDSLLTALDAKLATAGGLAKSAYLVRVKYEGGASGHLLAFIGAEPGAEGALAKAANEALIFSGIEAGAMDVGFFQASEAITAQMARVGLRFDLPAAQDRTEIVRPAPGSDPDKPPKLR